MSVHAVLSPSSAVRWMTCPGSVALSEGIKDTGSANADEGTMMHTISALCLETGTDAAGYIGTTDKETGLILQADQAKDVQFYVDTVRDIVKATGGELLVEQRLPIAWMTNESGAAGTADAVILTLDELIVVDAKFGFKLIEADHNPQLMMYAAAAWDESKVAYDFKTVRLVIVQPRLNAKPEWTLSVDELMMFVMEVQLAADDTRQVDAPLVPSTKGCQWCRAKPNCPEIGKQILTDFDNVVPETADESDLARVMANADMIEGWIRSVRAEVERRLLAGEVVTGYKLVQGKRGNRQWGNPVDAEAALKAMRVKHEQMYDYKLASPTTIEKLAKAKEIGPRQWVKIQELITQSEGQPSVAPESDKRPALVTSAVVSDFDDVTNP
jgi:hypothetical protein